MTSGQLWTPARIKTLRSMWIDGHTLVAISDVLGCSSTAIRRKIEQLELLPRSAGKTITKSMRGGIASALMAREEDETRVVKLAPIGFQKRRLPGEGSLW